MNVVGVPLLLLLASTIMAFAWLGHLRFRDKPFGMALAASWLMVLPEYVLNVAAFRWGAGTYSGAQMAAFHMAAGVVCVALVSRGFLGEHIRKRQWLGFGLMVVAMVLIRDP